MQNTAWFTEARFGMFVHWGLYALPARHEWVMSREEIAPADYERYVRYFDPDRYDPVEWARAAADAGMRYVVLTTKHHEGFCRRASASDAIGRRHGSARTSRCSAWTATIVACDRPRSAFGAVR